MKDIINGLIERFRRQHVQARRYVAMMLVLALLTTLFVNWQLHGVGISMTADYHCGYEEHQHTAACYEKVLTCGYEEGEPETPVTSSDSSADPVSAYSAAEPEEPEEPVQTEPETIWVPHEHTDACYEEHRVLTCYQEEHEHTDDCFDEYGALICGEFEHIHDDSCYTTEYELVCGPDEGELVEEPNPAYQEMPATRPVVDLPTEPVETTPEEPVLHHHTDACYTEELVCTIPEHHHTVECPADTQADVETAEEWQAAANVALNGNWAEDLLTVAKSQLDYQQSDKNFKLDVEDQQVLRGYSRYGAWYGNPYGARDVMFLSYCLHFAGVPQTVVPQRAGVMALHSDLRGSQWLTDADGSTRKARRYRHLQHPHHRAGGRGRELLWHRPAGPGRGPRHRRPAHGFRAAGGHPHRDHRDGGRRVRRGPRRRDPDRDLRQRGRQGGRGARCHVRRDQCHLGDRRLCRRDHRCGPGGPGRLPGGAGRQLCTAGR